MKFDAWAYRRQLRMRKYKNAHSFRIHWSFDFSDRKKGVNRTNTSYELLIWNAHQKIPRIPRWMIDDPACASRKLVIPLPFSLDFQTFWLKNGACGGKWKLQTSSTKGLLLKFLACALRQKQVKMLNFFVDLRFLTFHKKHPKMQMQTVSLNFKVILGISQRIHGKNITLGFPTDGRISYFLKK